MTKLSTLAIIAALCPLTACGGDDDTHGHTEDQAEGEPMSTLVTSMGSELAELQTLVGSHGDTVGSAPDLAAIADAEGSYHADALLHHEEMHHAVDDMTACTHHGESPALGPTTLTLEEVEMELNAHAAAMSDAADVAAAQEEETRHQEAMAELMGTLGDERDGLATEGDAFTCAHADDVHADDHMH